MNRLPNNKNPTFLLSSKNAERTLQNPVLDGGAFETLCRGLLQKDSHPHLGRRYMWECPSINRVATKSQEICAGASSANSGLGRLGSRRHYRVLAPMCSADRPRLDARSGVNQLFTIGNNSAGQLGSFAMLAMFAVTYSCLQGSGTAALLLHQRCSTVDNFVF